MHAPRDACHPARHTLAPLVVTYVLPAHVNLGRRCVADVRERPLSPHPASNDNSVKVLSPRAKLLHQDKNGAPQRPRSGMGPRRRPSEVHTRATPRQAM